MVTLDKFLNQLSRLSKDSSITYEGSVSNSTREGSYIKVKSGLTRTLWFVGKDLSQDKLIVENTGQ